MVCSHNQLEERDDGDGRVRRHAVHQSMSTKRDCVLSQQPTCACSSATCLRHASHGCDAGLVLVSSCLAAAFGGACDCRAHIATAVQLLGCAPRRCWQQDERRRRLMARSHPHAQGRTARSTLRDRLLSWLLLVELKSGHGSCNKSSNAQD